MSGIDQAALRAELGGRWLDGLDGAEREEGARLLDWLVADWAREADATPDPAAVLAFQRADLDARAAGDPLGALRAHVLARRVDRLGAATFALGREVAAGPADDAAARADGEALRRQADALATELRALPPGPELDGLRRALGDAAMEALFAIERKAMSPRLARELGGPPGLR
jgi:hypothetical protein